MAACVAIDFLSPWIKNKQLIPQINAKDWNKVQHEVIKNVFDGFESMLSVLLKDRFILNITQQNALHQILHKYVSNPSDIFENYRKDETVSIFSVPDDCLSYIMRYLTSNDRCTVQQCCRLFTVTARQESSVNHIEKEFPMMNLLPFRNTIIDGIQSADETENQKALELFSKCLKLNESTNTASAYTPLEFIKCFNDDTYSKFKKLILNNKSELSQNIGVHIFKQNFDTGLVPLMLQKYALNFEEMVSFIKTHNESAQLVGLVAINKLLMLTANDNALKETVNQITESNVVPNIVKFLSREHNELQSIRSQCAFQAASIITHVAFIEPLSVVSYGAVEGFICSFRNARNLKDTKLMNAAIDGLCNVAQESKAVLSTGILSDIVHVVEDNHSTESTLIKSLELLSILFRTLSEEFIASSTIIMERVILLVTKFLRKNENSIITVYCLSILKYLSFKTPTLHCLCDNGAVDICMKLLHQEVAKYTNSMENGANTNKAILTMNDDICKPCLIVLTQMVSDDDQLTQFVLDAGYLNVIDPFIGNIRYQLNILWSLANILAGTWQHIDTVLSRPKIIETIVGICLEGKSKKLMNVKREAVYCICNVCANGTTEQKKRFAEFGCVEALCFMLAPIHYTNGKNLQIIIEGLESFLDAYRGKHYGGYNLLTKVVEACNGLDYLRRRCHDSNIPKKTRDHVTNVISRYW